MTDARLVLSAAGSLREFNEVGVLAAADVHVAHRLAELAGESDEAVMLAAALAVRGRGSATSTSTSRRSATPSPLTPTSPST
jgi:exodeoxyribonuclease V alpha subunit